MFAARDDFIVFCEGRAPLVARDVPCLPAARGIDELTAVSVRDLRAFLAYEQTHRPAPSSQARMVAALRCFFRFCVESEYLDRDPAQVLRTPEEARGVARRTRPPGVVTPARRTDEGRRVAPPARRQGRARR